MTFGAKATTAALKTLASAGNMLLMYAVTKGIQAACKALDNWKHKLNNAKNALITANDTFESTQSEISSLESEMQKCSSRTKELQRLSDSGIITVAEQEELNALKAQNEELDRNIKLQQEKAKFAAMDAAKKASKALNTEVQSNYATEAHTSSYTDSMTGEKHSITYDTFSLVTPQEELKAATDRYHELTDEINDLKNAYDTAEISEIDYKNSLASLNNEQLTARARAAEMYAITTESEQAYKTLINSGESLTDQQ